MRVKLFSPIWIAASNIIRDPINRERFIGVESDNACRDCNMRNQIPALSRR